MSDRRGFGSGIIEQILGRFSKAAKYVRRGGWGGGFNASGVRVDSDSALKTAAVWACCRYVSQTVAGLPWQVRTPKREGGGSEAAPMTNTIQWLLATRPNPELSSFQFRETLTHWALRKGNGYAEIERDGAGRPIALWPLYPPSVEVLRDERGELFYRYHQPDAGGYADFDARDIFHVRGFGDDAVGLSVIEFAAQSIGWAQATEIFGATFFGEGMNPSMVISTTKTLTIPAKDQLRQELESIHKGARKGGRVAIVDGGMKAERVTNSAEESQFIETRQLQVEEICRWFGVPPHKIAHLLRATFSNIEHQSIEVVTDCIYPWAKRFQDEADFKLFGSANRRGFYTVMNLKGLLRGDAAARANYYQVRRNMGSLAVDEIRELEDENPIGPEKGGDMYVMQGQYFTLEAIRAQSQQAIDGPPQPAPPPPPGPPDPDPDAEALEQKAAAVASLIGVGNG